MHNLIISLLLWCGLSATPVALYAAEAETDTEVAAQAEEEDNDPMVKLSETVITIPVNPGVALDDVVESMKLKANELNLKFVGFQPLWQEYEALGLPDIQRTEIFQFCDAAVAKKMLDFDINFMAFMPCRIGLIERKDGSAWLVTMNLNIFLSADNMPEDLTKLAMEIRDNLELVMEAGAAGDL